MNATAQATGTNRGGASQQPQQPQTVADIIQSAVAGISQADPAMGRDLGLALQSANIPDTGLARAAVTALANGVQSFLSGTTQTRTGLANLNNEIFPTRDTLDRHSETINTAMEGVRGSVAAIGAAIANLSRVPGVNPASLTHLQDADIRTRMTVLDRDVDAPIRRIQAEHDDIVHGPTSHAAFAELLSEGPDAAAIDLGTLRNAGGDAISLEVEKRDGIAYARFTIASARGATPTEIEYRLDYSRTERDVTAVDQATAFKTLHDTQMRIQSRLHALVTEWDSLDAASATPPADRDAQINALTGRGGYGLIAESRVGQALYEAGSRISTMRNGELQNVNIAGMDLSHVVLDNFSIRDCDAHSIRLAHATLRNGSRIDNNDMMNADCSYVTFERAAAGGTACAFTRNDMHGRNGKLTGTNFNDVLCTGNNLMGVDMNGIRADSLVPLAGEQGGAIFSARANARAAFRRQFDGSLYSVSQMSQDPQNTAIFSRNSVAGGGSPTTIASYVQDVTAQQAVDVLNGNPLFAGRFTVTPGAPASPGAGIHRPGTGIAIESIDGSVQRSAHIEDGARSGHFGDPNGTMQRSGNLDLIEEALVAANQNRRSWSAMRAGQARAPSVQPMAASVMQVQAP